MSLIGVEHSGQFPLGIVPSGVFGANESNIFPRQSRKLTFLWMCLKSVVSLFGHVIRIILGITKLEVFRVYAKWIATTRATMLNLFPRWNRIAKKDPRKDVRVNQSRFVNSTSANLAVPSMGFVASKSTDRVLPLPAIGFGNNDKLYPKSLVNVLGETLRVKVFRVNVRLHVRSIRFIEFFPHAIEYSLNLPKNVLSRNCVRRFNGEVSPCFCVANHAQGKDIAFRGLLSWLNETIYNRFTCSFGFSLLRSWRVLTMFVHMFVLCPPELLTRRALPFSQINSVNQAFYAR